MPTLSRFIVFLVLIGLVAYGAVFALATFIEPKPREITIRVPTDRLIRE